MKNTKSQHKSGPKTEAGKNTSRQNAIKHGLLSTKLFVLSNEDQTQYTTYLNDLIQTFQPTNSLQLDLVTEMAGARWRLHRLWSIESGLFEAAIANHPDPADATTSRAFEKLANSGHTLSLTIRYEARIRRSFERALANLLTLQKATHENQLTEATNEIQAATTTEPQQTKAPQTEIVKTPNKPRAARLNRKDLNQLADILVQPGINPEQTRQFLRRLLPNTLL